MSYPGLPSHPDHEIAVRTLDGFGGMVGATIKGGTAGAERFLKRLRLFVHAPSLAGLRARLGAPDHVPQGIVADGEEGGDSGGLRATLLRHRRCRDLIADLEQALAR